MITKGRFYLVLFIISLVALLSWAGVRINKVAVFDEKVEGYLQNYVEAGNMKTAEKNLNLAIESLEEMGLTKGQISIFWKNPNNNIGLWYNNLLESREVLTDSSEESALNKSIILEKQRDGLKGGTDNISVDIPEGISIYPYNRIYFWWSILSLAGCIGFVIALIYVYSCGKEDEPIIRIRKKVVA